MKKSTLVTLRCLAAVAVLFIVGGAFSTFALCSSAKDVLNCQAGERSEYLSPFFLNGVGLVTLVNAVFMCGLGVSAWRMFRKEARGADLLYRILKLELVYLCAMVAFWGVTGCMPVAAEGTCMATMALLPQMALGFPLVGLATIRLFQRTGVLDAVRQGRLRSKWLSAWALLAITVVAVIAGGALRRHFRHAILFARVDGPNMFAASDEIDYRAFRRCNLDYDSMMLFGPIDREEPTSSSYSFLSYCHRKALTGENEEAAKALVLLTFHLSRITSAIENDNPGHVLHSGAPTGPSLLVAPLGLSPILWYFSWVEPYRVPKPRAIQGPPLNPMTIEDIDADFRQHMKISLPPLTQALARVDLDDLERRAERVFRDCGQDYAWHADAFWRSLGQFRQTVQRYGQSSGPLYTPMFTARVELLRKAEEMGLGIASLRQNEWGAQSISAILTNRMELTISWPGMGEGTEDGDAELTSRLKQVRETLSSEEGRLCASLDATSSDVKTSP